MTFKSTQPEWAATQDGILKPKVQVFKSTQPEWAATNMQLMKRADTLI